MNEHAYHGKSCKNCRMQPLQRWKRVPAAKQHSILLYCMYYFTVQLYKQSMYPEYEVNPTPSLKLDGHRGVSRF